MNTKPIIKYEFALIKYVHDILTGEFINVGLSVVAPSINYSNLKCKTTSRRIKKTFPDVNSIQLKKQLKHIENIFEKNNSKNLSLIHSEKLEKLMLDIIPHDDSSIQWEVVGSGVSINIEKTFDDLFDKYIMKYEEKNIYDHKSDDVWRVFKKDLQNRKILSLVKPYTISTNDDELNFKHTLKNGSLHCLEALSFDLTTSEGIKDKARSWLGKVTSISKSNELFEIYYMVSSPSDKKLQHAFDNAISILKKSEIPVHIYMENESVKLADSLSNKLHIY